MGNRLDLVFALGPKNMNWEHEVAWIISGRIRVSAPIPLDFGFRFGIWDEILRLDANERKTRF